MMQVARSRGWLFAAIGVGVLGCCVCVGLAVFLLAPSRGTPYSQVLTAPPNTPMQSAIATDTAGVASPDAPSTATVVAVQGGLGLTKADWESGHTRTGDDVVGAVYDNRLVVAFVDGRVAYIEAQWTDAAAISEAEVEILSGSFMPSDASLVETYSPEDRPETIVRVYSSVSLANAFASDQWGGAEAGTFTVQYNMREGRITRLILSLGNNP